MREARFLLGGPQGAGLETAAQVLSTAFAIKGYYVYSYREYYSNIKGRHSYIQVRVNSEKLPMAPREEPHVIAVIDAESIFHHFNEAANGTVIVYDSATSSRRLEGIPSIEPETRRRIQKLLQREGYDTTVQGALRYAVERRGARLLPLDYRSILKRVAEKTGTPLFKARRFLNTIPLAASSYLTGLSLNALRAGFERRFQGRDGIVEGNMVVASIVYGILEEEGVERFNVNPPRKREGEFLVVSGNDIVAIGKVVGGVRYQSYYPITPAADESFTLEAHEDLGGLHEEKGGILVFQTEDEIAAISSAIGAALTGARSSTSTSGPGFDLMIEALGWAGINEVPVVVTYYQRGGPSTGLPTRGGQEDLYNALFAGHGQFPKIVLASGDHQEAFIDAILAENLAEKYQLPVIHLLDKFLANTIVTIEPPSLEDVVIERGALTRGGPDYKRFDKSKGPISPRALIGAEETVMWYTGDEHNPEGHITEDPENRMLMHDYRMRKLEIADEEIPEEDRAVLYGDGEDFLVIGWGSVKGAVLEALEILAGEGFKGAYLHYRVLSPFPSKRTREVLTRYEDSKVILAEHSVRPLLSGLISMHTGLRVRKSILKWTGRPIYALELAGAIEKLLDREEGVEVLSYGA
ncbi:MAG: 2-oxoacid:acceptor oxidoreductase subunit alpha [Desulfurococcales archaeon]|nr:2-oxoacid:acceptor oxidoreductase subunit alpha [Desulfurococcales archaeon]